MTPPVISQETKDLNFQAVAPQKNEPIMIRTKEHKSGLGKWVFLFFVLFAVSGYFAYRFYEQNQQLQNQLLDAETKARILSKTAAGTAGLTVLERLNKHILLPQAQSAQTSTLSNVASLKKTDTFYEYAQDGNLLVQFPNLEIIYDPSADVIVNARTKNTGQIAGAEARAMQGAISLDIRNGAGVAGLAGKTAQTFTGVKEYVVKTVGNGAKSDYPKTVIVNLSGKDVSGLEKQFGVSAVSVLPAGEKTSDADVVIILGRS